MPKRASDDIDHVAIEPASQKKPRKPLPEQVPLPKVDPLSILRSQTRGDANLPPHIHTNDPYTIFNLIFHRSNARNPCVKHQFLCTGSPAEGD